MKQLLITALALLAAGCVSELDKIACSSSKPCPSFSLSCQDGFCVDNGKSQLDSGGVGGGSGGSGGGGDGEPDSGGEDAGGGPADAGPCTADSQCLSGFCSDGQCCDARCDSPCTACNLTGLEGACSPAPADSAPAHGDCVAQAAGSCANDGKCDGTGSCRKWDAGTECKASTCDSASNAATAAAKCDGAGTCQQAADAGSCGSFVCQGALQCFASCAATAQCVAGNVCINGNCQPPGCSDGTQNGTETGLDCGGPGACPRCAGGQGCALFSDCLSGTCAVGNTCTSPTYAWSAGSYGACAASACAMGTQTRLVRCIRSDGTEVADSFCGAGKPAETQTCLNTSGCSWKVGAYAGCNAGQCSVGVQTRTVSCQNPSLVVVPDSYCVNAGTRPGETISCTNTSGCTWFAGSYGTCSLRCGGGSASRPVYCRNTVGAQVSNSWCAGLPPSTSMTCNTHPCVINVADLNASGPCWSPPTCQGGFGTYPSCPVGYAPTRSEQACGNPNSCGSNWALCTFRAVHGYGCANPTFVMGVSSRECTFQ